MRPHYLSPAPLVPWKTLPRPLALFENGRPVEVEVGFGNGEHLVRRALAEPELNLVGIELTWGSIRRALRKVGQAQCSNVRLLWEDARVALSWCFAPRSLARVIGLFPCPWPKKRHAKNRLFRRPFLELVNSRLADGGELVVVTDDAVYRDEILEEAMGTGFSCSVQVIGPSYGTKYERKWEGGGQKEFYELVLTKEQHRNIPVPGEVEVEKLRVDRFEPDSFKPSDVRGEMTVEFKSFLYDPVRERAMQEVMAVEPSLSQRFWIEIVRAGERWWIQPAPGCDVIPVASVQKALELVRQAC